MSILIVDDSRHIRIQLRHFLSMGGYSDLLFAENAHEAFKLLGITNQEGLAGEIDLILMDISMPEVEGIEACRKIKTAEHTTDIPVIMVTGNTSAEALDSAFQAGAVDYITKPVNKVELLARVSSVLRLKNEMDCRKAREKELLEMTMLLEETNKKLEQANEMLRRLSVTDGLTGISNRRYFEEFLTREWERACRYTRPLSALMLDIDFFKAYNDTYGHQRGDECLKQVARSLSDAVKRPSDIVARYGGEEFVVLLPETDLDGAVKIAEFIKEKVSDLNIPHAGSKVSQQVTLSIGIASMVPTLISKPEDLIAYADKALYQAKEGGRDRFEVCF